LNKELEKSSERVETIEEEMADYEQLVNILQKHVKLHSYGVEIYFSTSSETDMNDWDYVKSFLKVCESDEGDS
jgi:DUF971 family protein